MLFVGFVCFFGGYFRHWWETRAQRDKIVQLARELKTTLRSMKEQSESSRAQLLAELEELERKVM